MPSAKSKLNAISSITSNSYAILLGMTLTFTQSVELSIAIAHYKHELENQILADGIYFGAHLALGFSVEQFKPLVFA